MLLGGGDDCELHWDAWRLGVWLCIAFDLSFHMVHNREVGSEMRLCDGQFSERETKPDVSPSILPSTDVFVNHTMTLITRQHAQQHPLTLSTGTTPTYASAHKLAQPPHPVANLLLITPRNSSTSSLSAATSTPSTLIASSFIAPLSHSLLPHPPLAMLQVSSTYLSKIKELKESLGMQNIHDF